MSFFCLLCRPARSRELFFPMPKGFQGDPWLAQRRPPQHRIPKATRAGMKLPGLSPHPKPPPPQELGAAPIFHPFCFNPSAHPWPGLEIPTTTPGPDHFMVQARTATLTAPRLAYLGGYTPPHDLLPWLSPKTTTTGVFLQPFFGFSPEPGVEGHKPPFMALVLPHASRGFPEQAQPWLGNGGSPCSTKDKAEDSGWWDVLPPRRDLRHPWRLLRIVPARGARPPDGATMGALSGLSGTERGPSAGSVTPQEFSHVRGKICLLSRMTAGCYSGNRWLSGASLAPVLR